MPANTQLKHSAHTACRVCGNKDLREYLDLGQMPLSNNLSSNIKDALEVARLPLKVMLCTRCGLSQLSIVVDPKEMFSHYVYRSSINKGYVKHCREMAQYLKKKYGLTQASFMIDIAGNDCALLKEFKAEIGLDVLNIDPAKNLAKICVDDTIPALCKFWGYEAADEAIHSYRKADLITATNVFAHVDDVNSFLGACQRLLSRDGVIVLEFPYLINFLDKNEFDTIYFEHLSYFSIHPLDILCEQNHLEIMHVEKIPIHGGSVRVEIMHREIDHDWQGKQSNRCRDFTVSQCIRDEKEKYFHEGKYEFFAEQVRKAINNFRLFMRLSRNVAAFAASAKGNTLLNCAGITNELKYIVDETPEKIGMYSPGTGVRIVSMKTLKLIPPDYLLILSWNFADEIMKKCRAEGYKGKFVIPIPEIQIIE
jgi:hypothetical protein